MYAMHVDGKEGQEEEGGRTLKTDTWDRLVGEKHRGEILGQEGCVHWPSQTRLLTSGLLIDCRILILLAKVYGKVYKVYGSVMVIRIIITTCQTQTIKIIYFIS